MIPPLAPQQSFLAPPPPIVAQGNNFNWPQAPQGHSGFNIAELMKALNAPSQQEQRHLDWVGAQTPSYMGDVHNPFNNGFFDDPTGAKARKQSEANANVGFATNTNVNRPNVLQAGAVLASPPPVAIPNAGNQTGNPIDYNAIAGLRQWAGKQSPFGQWK